MVLLEKDVCVSILCQIVARIWFSELQDLFVANAALRLWLTDDTSSSGGHEPTTLRTFLYILLNGKTIAIYLTNNFKRHLHSSDSGGGGGQSQ